MLKLWGRISSISVRKVVLTAQLLEVPFGRTDAGAAFGVTKTPEYLDLNPNALVPTLEHDDFALWESNATVRYLCAKRSVSAGLAHSLRRGTLDGLAADDPERRGTRGHHPVFPHT